jgi:hypothetical protein
MKRTKPDRTKQRDEEANAGGTDEQIIEAYVAAFHRDRSPEFLLDHAEETARWVREHGAAWQDEEISDQAQAKENAEKLQLDVLCARSNLDAGNHLMLAGWLFWIGRKYQELRPEPLPAALKADVARGRKVRIGAGTGGPKPMSEADIWARSEAWRPFVVAEMVSPKVKPWAAAGRAAKTIQKELKLQKPPGQRSVYDYVFNSEKLIEKARKKAAKRRRKD